MGQYAGAVVTTAGLNLISAAIANQETVTFTSVEASSYELPAGTNIESLASLQDVEQTTTPTNVGVYNSNIVQLIANFENSTVANDYSVETLGVWAKRGSNSPVLFAVIQAITPDTMPQASLVAPTSIIFRIQMTVTNADQVTVQVVAAGAATVADLAYYLPTANVYNGLNQSGSGYALDARQGAALDGRLATVESYVTAHDTAVVNGSITTYADSINATGLYPFITSLTTTDLPSASTYYTQANGFVLYRKSTNDTVTIVLYGRDDSIWIKNKSGGNPWGSWVQMLDTGEAASTYVPKTDIVNNFSQATAGKVLDANAGYTLNNSVIRARKVLETGSDLNSTTDIGTYVLGAANTYTNLPTGVSSGILMVVQGANLSSILHQLIFDTQSPTEVYFRGTNDSGSTWKSWQRIARSAELSSYLPTANVYNGLGQTNAGYALDARQGATLNSKFASYLLTANVYNGLDQTASGYALDARQGKALGDMQTVLTTGTVTNGTDTNVSGYASVLRKVGNIVMFSCAFTTSATVASNTTIFQLGTGYRPDSTIYFCVGASNANNARPLYIDTNGRVRLNGQFTAGTFSGSVTFAI